MKQLSVKVGIASLIRQLRPSLTGLLRLTNAIAVRQMVLLVFGQRTSNGDRWLKRPGFKMDDQNPYSSPDATSQVQPRPFNYVKLLNTASARLFIAAAVLLAVSMLILSASLPLVHPKLSIALATIGLIGIGMGFVAAVLATLVSFLAIMLSAAGEEEDVKD